LILILKRFCHTKKYSHGVLEFNNFMIFKKNWMHKKVHKGGVYSNHVHTWICFFFKLGFKTRKFIQIFTPKFF